jgi:hypothetical protein
VSWNQIQDAGMCCSSETLHLMLFGWWQLAEFCVNKLVWHLKPKRFYTHTHTNTQLQSIA